MQNESLRDLIKSNFNFNWLIFTNEEIHNIQRRIFQKDEKGEYKLDEHNHLIQIYDLEDIAYAFEKWAKEQNLSFWR